LDLRQLKPQYVTNEAGEKTAIILPIEEFTTVHFFYV
jgi:hypothetical protein